MTNRLVQLYVVTPAVFCSVILGGGYGTGREVVEYFTRLGPSTGLVAIATAASAFFLVLFATFEVARRHGAHDYRTFFQHLLGRYWWLYEALYLVLFVLVIGVIGSAVQTLLAEQLGVPGRPGMLVLFALVVVITLWGRNAIERLLTAWAVLMFGVFFYYLASMGVDFSRLHGATWKADAVQSGLLYAGYNIAVFPVLLFTVRGLSNPREAAVSALLTAFAICLPAVLFHLSYLKGMPSVLDQSLPNYWMIQRFGPPLLLTVFTIALTGTLIETASGLVQGFIERLEHSRAQPLGVRGKLIVSVALMGCGGLAGELGIVTLIASGYSAMSIGFLLVYVVPMLYHAYRTRWKMRDR